MKLRDLSVETALREASAHTLNFNALIKAVESGQTIVQYIENMTITADYLSLFWSTNRIFKPMMTELHETISLPHQQYAETVKRESDDERADAVDADADAYLQTMIPKMEGLLTEYVQQTDSGFTLLNRMRQLVMNKYETPAMDAAGERRANRLTSLDALRVIAVKQFLLDHLDVEY